MQLFVDHLCNVDFSYLDPFRGIVGETWLTNVIMTGELDEQGMICDFGQVKKHIRQWLDLNLDHCLLVPKTAPQLNYQRENDRISLQWQLTNNKTIQLKSPQQAIALVDTDQIDPESCNIWAGTQLLAHFRHLQIPLKSLQLEFITEFIQGPYYHYSHGLKKHDGNCQRIAHGHRSKLEVWLDGELAVSEAELWAKQWRDIYIGSEDDLIDTTKPIDSSGFQSDQNLLFRYQAIQGEFELEIPQQYCYLIPTDSTVEYIALYIAKQIKAKYPDKNVAVKAYEGWKKGAKVEL